ncbi:MAG: DEAD/DEAH box helicase [Rhodothermales bacterium]|nr:DEAD/DEAH box helicase [Rhodothermales bacterium]
MSDEPKKKRRFPAVIDLTSKAQEAAKVAANPPAPAETTDPDALDTSLDALPEAAQAAARSAGWMQTMPVQARTMPYLLDGKDVIVQSKTGSGKTGAFLLPLFARLDPARRGAQALVLTPTRELAKQIYEEFLRLKGNRPEVQGLDAVLVYGGVGYGEQTAGLKGGAQLVIGTPGRILDHLERRTLNLDHLSTLVLDEADEMLSMGFLPAMNKLRRYLPDKRQSTMFSATMPPTVRRLAETFLTEPTFLALAGGDVNVDALAHRFYVVPAMDKDRALVRLIELENPETAILFANTKREVEYLAQFLRNYGHDAGELSGDLNQNAREAIMQRLRDGNLRFLVATDVAARGIDISDLSHVIQYDVPQDPEYYVHRAGRTARAGKTGVSITLTTQEDKNKLLAIARRYDLDFDERPMPTDEQVTERVRERLTTLLEDRYRDTRTLARERSARFEPLVTALAEEEPHLLTMLLDGLYHDSLHAKPQDELNRLAQQRATERREREWDDDGRGPRGRKRRDDRRRDEPRPASEPPALDALRAGERDAAQPNRPTLDALRAGEMEMPIPAHDAHERLETSTPHTAAALSAQPSSNDGRRRNKRRQGDRPAEAVETSPDEAAETPNVAMLSDDTPDDAATTDDAASGDAETVENLSSSEQTDRTSGRSRRRGRGRRKPRPEAEEANGSAEVHATDEPVATRQTGADVLPPPPPARPPVVEPQPEPAAEATDAKPRAKPSRTTKKATAIYSVFDLRAMSDEALREVGEEVLDTLPDDRSDLLYAILDAQAVRESSGRGRRGAEPSSGRGRAGDRSSEKRSAKPGAAKRESAKSDTKPTASSEASKPHPAKAEATPSKSSRRKRRRKDGAGPLAPLATDVASAEPAATPSAEAPKREAKPKRARAKKIDAEAPAVEASSAETPPAEAAPKRSRAKAAAAPAETTDEKPKRARAKKADPAEATPVDAAPEKPKRSRAKKTDDAPGEARADAAPPSRAPKADTPVAETTDEKPKRSRTKKTADASAAATDSAAEKPKRSRATKSDASESPSDAVAETTPKRTRAKTADTPDADTPKPRPRSKKTPD